MKILVCLKQVPDSTVRVAVDHGGTGIVESGMVWSISPNDEFAIEMALTLKDQDPDTTVEGVTIGPERSRDALRHALAMGCDDATLVLEEEPLGGLAVARVLAAVVADRAPDLVLCGRQAADDDQGFVGPALAEFLGYPHLSMLTDLQPSGDGIKFVREVEGGHEVWTAAFPVVGIIHKSVREPRYPSLPRILKAKRAAVPELAVASIGADLHSPRSEVVEMVPPPPRGDGRIFRGGDVRETAEEIVRLLRDERKVL